ncbi:MAG TPA: signal peptidase I [Acidimicrobiales bacterium]|nr:signal peptidase I [Acidimicrobiales bacterium]
MTPPEPTEPTLVAEDARPVDLPTSAGPAGRGRHAKPPSKSTSSRWFREGLFIVLVALVLALLLRLFVVQTFYIPSGSMEPTLNIGDRILVNKLSYHLHSIQRGDIVVFSRPPAEDCGGAPVNDLVKRVVGLPGETVSLTKGAKSYLVINGKRLDEPWLPAVTNGMTFPGPSGTSYSLTTPYLVPFNHYFVMGDNRTQSCDSRYWGPIARALIVGKVEMRIWPVTDLHFF